MAMNLECDRDGCTSKQNAGSAMEGGAWLTVHLWANSSGDPEYFCTVDCLLGHFARFEVPETVPHD
jgi:hypothetical protein